jgi:hypothetical protein
MHLPGLTLLATLGLTLATAAHAAPPDLVEGPFHFDLSSTYDETLVRCGDDWVLTWGIHPYTLRAEGDTWVHPQKARCKNGGSCSGAYRVIGPSGTGLIVNRYNAARAAEPGFDPHAFSGEQPFGWRNEAAPVAPDLHAALCSRIEDWPYLPPNP